jgi:hypothetical protein
MMPDLALEKIQFLKSMDALIDYHNLVRARIEALTKREKGKTMNWMNLVIRALTNIPLIVAGIEHIHGDAKSGAEKKQLAMEALGLASIVAPQIDPGDQPMIDAAAGLASQTIDGVVAVMNAGKAAAKTPNAAPQMPQEGLKPPVPISPLAPQPQAMPAGESPKAPSSLDSQPPQIGTSETSLWP